MSRFHKRPLIPFALIACLVAALSFAHVAFAEEGSDQGYEAAVGGSSSEVGADISDNDEGNEAGSSEDVQLGDDESPESEATEDSEQVEDATQESTDDVLDEGDSEPEADGEESQPIDESASSDENLESPSDESRSEATDAENSEEIDPSQSYGLEPQAKVGGNLSSATVSAIASQAYTGKTLKPKPVVKYGNTVLKEGTDYTVSYMNNNMPGIATVVITGRGNYQGTRTVTFRIAEPFRDVNTKTSHYSDILWLYTNKITTGFVSQSGVRTFQPFSNVTRCDMAAFLYRLAGSPSFSPTDAQKRYFSDVNSKTPHAKEIWWLASVGISMGWTEKNGTHTFRPYANVARCDMAAFLYRLAGSPSYSPSSARKRYFSDISTSSPHAREVWWLASTEVTLGWAEGDGSRTFRPYSNVTRCDMAAFLHRMKSKKLVADPGSLERAAKAASQNRNRYSTYSQRYQKLCDLPKTDRRFAGTYSEMAVAGYEQTQGYETLMNELLSWVKTLPGADKGWLDRTQAQYDAELEAALKPIRDEFNASPYSGYAYSMNLSMAKDKVLCARIEELLDYARSLLGM